MIFRDKDAALWAVAAAALTVASGCGKRTAPDPDLLGQQLAVECLDAVAAGNRDLAVSKSSRLLALDASTPGTEELLRLVIDNDAIQQVAKKQTPREAMSLLDEVRSEHGSSGRLDDAAHALMDLELVARYAENDWQRAGPMALAFGDLPAADSWPDTGYAAWHAAEAKRLAEMQEAERRRLTANLLKTLDRSEVAGDEAGAAAALAQMRRLMPEHAVAGGDGELGKREAAELAAWRAVRSGSTVSPELTEPVLTLSGKGALALMAARSGDYLRALALWRELKEAFPPAADEMLVSAFPVEANKARLARVPSASGVLGLLAAMGGDTSYLEEENPNKNKGE